MLLFSACCKKNMEKQPEELVVAPITDESLITTKSSEIIVHYTDATLFGTVKNKDGLSYSEYGFLYGADENNVNNWVSGKYSDGKITAIMGGLVAGKKYWYRAAARVGKNTYQSKAVETFITFPQGPIDLNLPSHLKWADKNVGADYPTDAGGYYSWGETATKKYYDWTTYVFGDGTNTIRVSTLKKYGDDGKKQLDPEDDAAHVVMGGNWRMPDSVEIEELFNACDFKRVTINGVNGVRFISKRDMDEENFLFFPLSGYMVNGAITGAGDAYYWSRTVYESSLPSAYNGHLNNISANIGHGYRYYGETVRAVCE